MLIWMHIHMHTCNLPIVQVIHVNVFNMWNQCCCFDFDIATSLSLCATCSTFRQFVLIARNIQQFYDIFSFSVVVVIRFSVDIHLLCWWVHELSVFSVVFPSIYLNSPFRLTLLLNLILCNFYIFCSFLFES